MYRHTFVPADGSTLQDRAAKPVEPGRTPGPLMLALLERHGRNTVWRFYRAGRRRWRWQHLTAEWGVIALSSASYRNYNECRAAAESSGYIFCPGTHIDA